MTFLQYKHFNTRCYVGCYGYCGYCCFGGNWLSGWSLVATIICNDIAGTYWVPSQHPERKENSRSVMAATSYRLVPSNTQQKHHKQKQQPLPLVTSVCYFSGTRKLYCYFNDVPTRKKKTPAD